MNTKSKKGFTLVEIMIVVVIIGLLAAMAIPAFQKVREQSREKAITNNLRQIASAGQQYILEEGVTQATYAQLEGDYFNEISAVADETYTAITVLENGGTISAGTTGGMTVVFTY
ncbi:type II secretion system protein [Cerasicoccus fimbriatus]|uniref:type II secretion system protein n=1 Tax=Cerasicoccus fimbriatus TaxID=3014554 RepID=UPI0022B59FA5|nr:type II secretion system protein [Cerasicoccus sp. TK19100]